MTVPAAFPAPATPGDRPLSYATQNKAAAYLRTLAARPAPAGRRVYLTRAPWLVKRPWFARERAAVATALPRAEIVDWDEVFASAADYAAGWPILVGQLAGLVVMLPGTGALGACAGRELSSAVKAGLPVIVWKPVEGGRAFIDCRIEPCPNPVSTATWLVTVPRRSPEAQPLPTWVATVAAMGGPTGGGATRE